MEIKVGTLPGITSFLRICIFVAPIERSSNILLPSVARNPFIMVMMVTITVISTAIKMMDLLPLPNHTMMIGPSAIFGRLFKTTI